MILQFRGFLSNYYNSILNRKVDGPVGKTLYPINKENRTYYQVSQVNISYRVEISKGALEKLKEVTPPKATGLGPHVPGELIVEFKEGVTEAQKKQLHEENSTEVLWSNPRRSHERVQSKIGESTEELIDRYRRSPLVEYAGSVRPPGFFVLH